ncbi:hypothetical protein ScPMuIL_006751 [Solemya velum]
MFTRRAVGYASLYLVYTVLVYVRRSFTYVLPAAVESDSLDDNQLGLIMSSQAFAKAGSKFVSGILADLCQPRLLIAGGLGVAGLATVAFALCESPLLMAVWWFMNGLAGGVIWPACGVLLKSWFPAEQFGTAWSVLSTSMNVAGTVGPLFTAYMITISGWRHCMFLGGVVAMVIAAFCLLTIPSMDADRDQAKVQKSNKVESRLRLLGLPGFLGTCLSYCVVTLVQYATLQWGQLFLVKHRGQMLVTSGAFLSSLEVGGIIGSILAGYASDYLISKKFYRGRVRCRLLVVMWLELLLALSLYLFIFQISPDSSKLLTSSIGFGIGFSVYGSISLFGVIAMESAPDHLSGTTHAISSLFASGGQVLAGLPFTLVVEMSDWDSAFLLQLTLIVTMLDMFTIPNKLNFGKDWVSGRKPAERNQNTPRTKPPRGSTGTRPSLSESPWQWANDGKMIWLRLQNSRYRFA